MKIHLRRTAGFVTGALTILLAIVIMNITQEVNTLLSQIVSISFFLVFMFGTLLMDVVDSKMEKKGAKK